MLFRILNQYAMRIYLYVVPPAGFERCILAPSAQSAKLTQASMSAL